MAASKEELDQIHSLLTAQYLRLLKGCEVGGGCETCGCKPVLDPRILTTITRFLKDNQIEKDPEKPRNPVEALAERTGKIVKLPFTEPHERDEVQEAGAD